MKKSEFLRCYPFLSIFSGLYSGVSFLPCWILQIRRHIICLPYTLWLRHRLVASRRCNSHPGCFQPGRKWTAKRDNGRWCCDRGSLRSLVAVVLSYSELARVVRVHDRQVRNNTFSSRIKDEDVFLSEGQTQNSSVWHLDACVQWRRTRSSWHADLVQIPSNITLPSVWDCLLSK